MTFYFRFECVDQTARVLISVTELTRNDFQQKRLEGDLQHPSCQLRSAFRLGLTDGFGVRFVYSSLTFTPCWIAILVSKKNKKRKLVLQV